MFQSITSLFWASEEDGIANEPGVKGEEDVGTEVSEAERRLKVTNPHEDDDWLLVDHSSRGSSCERVSSSPIRCRPRSGRKSSCHCSPRSAVLGDTSSDSAASDSDVSTLADCGATESFLVTPPPCFMLPSPTEQVDADPFENMLIEHPSMSVYVNRPCGARSGRGGSLSDSNSDISDDAQSADDAPIPRGAASRRRGLAVVHRTSGRSIIYRSDRTAEMTVAKQRADLASSKVMQKAWSRNQCHRSNLVCRSKGRSQHRSRTQVNQPAGRSGHRSTRRY